MSKIICDICGTSYPESAKQCPICGCVRPGDAQSVTSTVKGNGNNPTGYTQVKGGHFAKNNVKKRTKDAGQKPAGNKNNPPMNYETDRENRGLVIVAIVLLLAVIGVVIYIAIHFFGPISNPNDNSQPSGNIQSAVSCTDIILDSDSLTFSGVGEVLLLNIAVEPKNTTDLLTYRSEDPSVVTVNSVGKVTVVGEGTTNIVITCGKVTKICAVSVQIQDDSTGTENTEDTSTVDPTGESINTTEELRLNRKDITFSSKGSKWNLYDGSIPRNQINWTSDNVSVASITDGVVMAVGAGETVVYAEYGDQKVSCIIRCSFKDSSGISGNGGVSEDGGGSGTGSSVTGTVNTAQLNIRENPGVDQALVGSLTMGDRVTILEQKTVGNMTWGKISQGWISMDYVRLD